MKLGWEASGISVVVYEVLCGVIYLNALGRGQHWRYQYWASNQVAKDHLQLTGALVCK